MTGPCQLTRAWGAQVKGLFAAVDYNAEKELEGIHTCAFIQANMHHTPHSFSQIQPLTIHSLSHCLCLTDTIPLRCLTPGLTREGKGRPLYCGPELQGIPKPSVIAV